MCHRPSNPTVAGLAYAPLNREMRSIKQGGMHVQSDMSRARMLSADTEEQPPQAADHGARAGQDLQRW